MGILILQNTTGLRKLSLIYQAKGMDKFGIIENFLDKLLHIILNYSIKIGFGSLGNSFFRVLTKNNSYTN